LLKNADKSFKAGDLTAALKEVENALQIDPGNFYARAYKDRILSAQQHAVTKSDKTQSEEENVENKEHREEVENFGKNFNPSSTDRKQRKNVLKRNASALNKSFAGVRRNSKQTVGGKKRNGLKPKKPVVSSKRKLRKNLQKNVFALKLKLDEGSKRKNSGFKKK